MLERASYSTIERMNKVIHIGLIGDYDQEVTAHRAIPLAIELAANELACPFELEWLETPLLEQQTEQMLIKYHASMDGPSDVFSLMVTEQQETILSLGFSGSIRAEISQREFFGWGLTVKTDLSNMTLVSGNLN
ncbi:UNVERIFIED_CONTAM: hypothetical protein ABIC26_000459 [Paenibacillus sp. PvR008]